MEYTCGVCKKKVGKDFYKFVSHTEGHIIDVIKKSHPQWIEKNGVCGQCLEYYHKQIKGEK
jgi:hypothetical protein